MLGSIKAINDGIALSNSMPANKMPPINMKGGSGPLINDQEVIDRLNRMFTMSARIDENALITSLPKVTGSEDAHMLVRDYKTTVSLRQACGDDRDGDFFPRWAAATPIVRGPGLMLRRSGFPIDPAGRQ